MRRPTGRRGTKLFYRLGAMIALLACSPAARAAEIDASEIIQRAFDAAERNEEIARQYTFHERVEERNLDKRNDQF